MRRSTVRLLTVTLTSCLGVIGGLTAADPLPEVTISSGNAQAYHLYSLALQSLLRRDYSDALTLMERAAARDTAADLRLEVARLHYSLNSLLRAEELAQLVAAERPDISGAHKLLADIHLRRAQSGHEPESNTLEAIREYHAALEADPRDGASVRTLAELYYEMGESEKLVGALRGFARHARLDNELRLLLAKAYVRTGMHDEAEIVLLEVLSEAPRNLEAADALGALYEFKKRYDDAIRIYESQLDSRPDDAYLHHRIGSLHLEAGRYHEALHSLREGQRLAPEDVSGLLALGRAYEGLGEFGAAADSYAEILRHDASHLEGRFHLARAHRLLGDWRAALEGFQTTAELAIREGTGTDREAAIAVLALGQSGMIEMDRRRFGAAAAAFERALRVARAPHPELHLLLGRAMLNQGDLQGVKTVVSEAARLYPHHLELQLFSGEVLIASGRSSEALDLYAKILEAEGHSARIYLKIAEALLRQRSYEQAERLLTEGTSHHPEDDRLLFTRGAVMERLGLLTDAERFLQMAIDLNPNNAMALNYLGYMLADRGLRLDESVTYVQRALELDPDNPAYMDSLGWALFKLASYEMAEEKLRAALRYDQHDPTIREHLGDLLRATGRLTEAAREWEVALDRGHESPERLRRKLEEVRAALRVSE